MTPSLKKGAQHRTYVRTYILTHADEVHGLNVKFLSGSKEGRKKEREREREREREEERERSEGFRSLMS